MFRTVLAIGIFAVLGLFVLKIIFGLFGVAWSLFTMLLGWTWWLGWRILLVGAVVYVVLLLVSPATARKMRDTWGGGR